jgi:hypothetical protein
LIAGIISALRVNVDQIERSDVKTWLNGNMAGQKSYPCLPETLKITVEKEY